MKIPPLLLYIAMSAYRDEDPRIHDIKTRIRVVPNFPKPGFFCFFFLVVENTDLAEIALWSRILELNSRIGCCSWVSHTKFLLDSKFCSFLKPSPSLSFSFHFHFERHRMFMLFCCFGKTRLSFHDSRLYVLFHVYILLYWRWKAENLWLCFFFGCKFISDGLLWQVLCFKISPPYYWILKHSRTQLICLLRDTKAKTFQLLQVKKQKQNSQERVKDPISAFNSFFFLGKFSFCLRCN